MATPNPNDEVFSLLSKKALEPSVDGEPLDLFRVRVLYRTIGGGGASVLFLFKDLPATMVQDIEAWLPILVENGRGQYEAQLYHEARKNDCFGTLRLAYQGDDAHHAPQLARFWETISQPNWIGPTRLMVIIPVRSSEPATLSSPAGGLSSQTQPLFNSGGGSASRPANEVDARRYENDLFRQSVLNEVRATSQQLAQSVQQAVAQLQTRPQPQGEDSMTKLAVLALPIVKEMMTDARADRARAEERQMALLNEMRKKPDADPLTQQLLQKAITEKPNEAVEKMVTIMGQGMMAMSQQVMQMGHFFMEMRNQLPQDQNGGIWDTINKAIDAWVVTVEKVGTTSQEAGEENAAQLAGGDDAEPLEVDPIIAVEMAVRQQRSPQEVGDMLVAAMANAEFRALLASYKNDIKEFVKARFGAWIAQEPEKRLAYISTVLPQAVQYAITKGAFARAPVAAAKVHQQNQAQAAQPAARPQAAHTPKAAPRPVAEPAARPEEPYEPQAKAVELVVPLEEKKNGRAKRQMKIQDVEPAPPEANEAAAPQEPASA